MIDLEGESLLPGFQDAHVHPIEGGMLSRSCDLHGLADAAAYLHAIAAHVAAHPEREWIHGSGWSLPAFPRGEPHRSLLDAIVPDRPAFFESDDGHVAWANSRALAISGIDRTTADPANGRIVRDADGEPAGTLHDGAIELVYRHAPKATRADLLEGLRVAQRHLHSLRDHRLAGRDRETRIAPRLSRGGRSRLADRARHRRAVVGAGRGAEQIEGFESQRAERCRRLRCHSVKLMLDGILESLTAFVTSPYTAVDGWAGIRLSIRPAPGP